MTEEEKWRREEFRREIWAELYGFPYEPRPFGYTPMSNRELADRLRRVLQERGE